MKTNLLITEDYMIKYCNNCDDMVEVNIADKIQVLNVLGEEIKVDTQVAQCPVCGDEVFVEELDSITLNKAYDIYRQNHKIIPTDDIIQLRNQYGLSQRSFAKLLRWSDKTIRSYENGSIPSMAHNGLLKLLKEPYNMKKYIEENEVDLDTKQLAKLEDKIDDIIETTSANSSQTLIDSLFNSKPSIENGFKRFDYTKFAAMVSLLAVKNSGLLKTKLMKLLNYSDMKYFKENSTSISGIKYIHLPYGPVPDNYEILLAELEKDGIIKILYESKGGYERYTIESSTDYYKDILSEEEIECLTKVNERFKDFGSKKISEHSHKEMGYKMTLPGDIISYEYAKDIRI